LGRADVVPGEVTVNAGKSKAGQANAVAGAENADSNGSGGSGRADVVPGILNVGGDNAGDSGRDNAVPGAVNAGEDSSAVRPALPVPGINRPILGQGSSEADNKTLREYLHHKCNFCLKHTKYSTPVRYTGK